ncbi:MAG: DUF1854 domain-containing protein [Clostridia bacterium]|nr:DUF1854 domain-containing protein [Clostridia bacterium]
MSNEIVKEGAANIVRLDKNNSSFGMKNGFLCAKKDDEGYDRVFLHRTFPFDKPWEYISVIDPDNNEIGIIYSISDYDAKTEELLRTELCRKYYEPRVKSIVSLKERYGFSYWVIITEEGRRVSLTMQDTFRNIIRIGDDKAVLLDVDGNRFVIESISGLDKKSHRKIELYI